MTNKRVSSKKQSSSNEFWEPLYYFSDYLKKRSSKYINVKKIKALKNYKQRLTLPLVLLSLASFVVIQAMPLLSYGQINTERPALWQICVVGLVIIALSAIFLSYTAKLIGLTRGWLILSLLFTSLIVITKFIIIPDILYSNIYHIGSGLLAFDPNNAGNYLYISTALFLSYTLILWISYKHFRNKVSRKLTPKKNVHVEIVNSVITSQAIFFLVLAFILVALASGGGLLLLPLFVLGPTTDYLNYAISNGGIVLVVSTVFAILFSVKYLDHSSNIAIKAKDGTILAAAFWIGLSLLFIYHVLWVVYMTVMLTIWPFKTISPSGK